MDQRMLRLSVHMEKIDEYHVAKWVLLILEISGGYVWDRPRLGWIDGVEMVTVHEIKESPCAYVDD